MTTGKTIALTRQTFVGKVMSLLLNMLSRLVKTFLPRSKSLNFMAAVTICSDFAAQKNSLTLFPLFPHLFLMKWWDRMPWYLFSECWALSQLFHRKDSWSYNLIPMNSTERREQITKLLKIWERFTFMSQEEDWTLQREKDARVGIEGVQENSGGREAADFPKSPGHTHCINVESECDCWRRWPTAVFLPGESHGQGSLVGGSPRGYKESDTTAAICVLTHVYNLYMSIYDPLRHISDIHIT